MAYANCAANSPCPPRDPQAPPTLSTVVPAWYPKLRPRAYDRTPRTLSSAIKYGIQGPGREHRGGMAAPLKRRPTSYVYSDLVGYQTSDIRLLWTITPNPPTPHPNTLSNPPPPLCQTFPPPPCPPPNIRLVPLSPHP